MEETMSESVYKIIEVVGTSPNSWEEAARNAVQTAGSSVRDLRVAEIVKLDMTIAENSAVSFRARVSLSFKYER
jgi:flavin-binding protein dodecin